MAASLLRSSVLAAAVSTVAGFAIGEFPTQTVGGFGLPFLPEVTAAPQRDLVKARLEKKALTNTCTEWTIPGGFGQPICSNSETCLFTSAGDFFYEGCGQTSVTYDWITRCWDYPIIGTPPASEIYCDSSEPACGYFAFVFAPGATFSNFGCSTKAYSLTVELLDTTSSSVILAGGGTTQVTVTPSTVYITPNPTVTVTPTGQAFSGSTARPSVGSHKKKKSNVGAIVGGVVGGVVILAALAVLAFLLFRKKKKDKAARQNTQTQQQQADAATAAAWSNQPPEIGGKPVQQPLYAPLPAGYAHPQNEKPMAAATAPPQAAYIPHPPPPSNYGSELSTEHAHAHAAQQSPPPLYAQPQPSSPPTRPVSNFTELGSDPNMRASSTGAGAGAPVSPIGTTTASSELGGVSGVSSPAPQYAELGGGGGENRAGLGQQVPAANVQELGASSGGINRVAAGQQRQSALDMSGAPMSEEYHHEMP